MKNKRIRFIAALALPFVASAAFADFTSSVGSVGYAIRKTALQLQ